MINLFVKNIIFYVYKVIYITYIHKLSTKLFIL